MKKPQILISNDDGIYGPGLAPLVRALDVLGEVTVIVPDQERSTASHALTLHKPLRVRQISPRTYVLNGTPADCVRFGCLHFLRRKVNLIVSGINSGVNMGEDVIYSGTVAGAVEGVMLGIPSIAVSRPSSTEAAAFVAAAQVTARVAQQVLKHGLPDGVCLNVNAPAIGQNGMRRIKGIRVTSLGHRLYGKKVTIGKDPRGRRFYWLLAKKVVGVPTPGSDVESFQQGYAVVTPIGIDWTAKDFMEKMRHWKF